MNLSLVDNSLEDLPLSGLSEALLSFKPGLSTKLIGYCLGNYIVMANVLYPPFEFPIVSPQLIQLDRQVLEFQG